MRSNPCSADFLARDGRQTSGDPAAQNKINKTWKEQQPHLP
jgi:hypothetical protein